MGRLTQLVDPDRGTHTYTYDADGNLIQDSSGSRTIGYAYDLLDRLGCVQDEPPQFSDAGSCGTSANGGSYNAFVQNTYDADPTGVSWNGTNYAKGRLTQSFAINYFPGPDYTQGKVTENKQYDQRGRVITQRLQLTATGGSLTFPTFPTFQQALTYNDADQLVTSTTSTTPAGQGFTFTNVYDGTGALSGLSDTTSTTPDLATLVYNARAQLDTINFQTSTGGALAAEQFGYDADLRTTSASATWGANSGNPSGSTIFSQGRTYDPAGNVTSLSTTQAVVPGTTNSGGSETEVFCYDEQNRLVWAGNSGTPPAAGNGTCGSGPSNSLSGATYSNAYVYTHLGQLWQGPLNGGSTQYQYLYCSSSQPHQLTGLYATSATCSNKTGQGYGSSYDAWGNVSSRSITNGTTLLTYTLSYDGLDHLVRWNDTQTTTNEEWYLYDGSGQRVLRRSQTGTGTSNTKYTVYAFGVQDDVYDGSGASNNDKYYYSLAGSLLGELNGGKTKFLLTDLLGSVVASISNTVGSAAVLGNQVYGPYGDNPYSKGAITTPKGYTGQYNDGLTQLDYYNARYYDPFVGVFLSADSTQGNMQGANPYAYVGGNPETKNDPTGLRPISSCPTGDCNAPVDWGALTAAIYAWASGGSNLPQTSQCGPLPEPAPVAQAGYGPTLPNSPQWHQIGNLVAFGYQIGNQIVSESVDEAFRLRQFWWPDDGGVSLNRLIAYQLAITAQKWRKDFQYSPDHPFGFKTSNNVGNGFYYVTDANGNLVTSGVQDPINGTNDKNPGEPFGYNHSEQRLLRDFNGIIAGLNANGQLQAGNTLHYVLFTQFKPCGISCSPKTFAQSQQAMQKLAGPSVNIDFSVWTSAQDATIPVTSATQVYQYYP